MSDEKKKAGPNVYWPCENPILTPLLVGIIDRLMEPDLAPRVDRATVESLRKIGKPKKKDIISEDE